MELIKIAPFRFAVSFALLAVASLAAVGCTRVDSTYEPSVVLLSSGTYTPQNGQAAISATLQMREEGGKLTLEVTQQGPGGATGPVATGSFEVSTLAEILAQTHGPMHPERIRSTLRVTQPCELNQPFAASAVGTSVSQATLKFVGNRWLEYNLGLLRRGMEGQLNISFMDPAGQSVAEYSGAVSRQPVTRDRGKLHSQGQVAVGTRLSGSVEGSYSLGGTLFGGGNPALIEINMLNGAGAIETSGHRQAFDFEPTSDVHEKAGVEAPRFVTQSETYLEFEDSFAASLTVPNVDFNDPGEHEPAKIGTATGDLAYTVTLTIDPYRVMTSAKVSLTADLRTHGGKKLTFSGNKPQIDAALAW